MQEVRLEKALLTDEQAAALEGTHLTDKDYRLLVGSNVAVYKPDGSLLLRLVTNAIPPELCRQGYDALRTAARESRNRGAAAGAPEVAPGDELQGKFRYRPRKQDGTLSNRVYARPVQSGVVGFVDRYTTYPYCRQTAFTMEKPELFAQALPLLQAVDRRFAEHVPDRYRAQMEAIRKTHPDFRIPDTAFTTITVNKNWQTAVHQDKGDLKEGFGVMLAFRAGEFEGCRLVFPQYGVAAEMATGDILFADVHEWHGNSPFRGIPGRYERISLVCYYREKMAYCGSAEEELEMAKQREKGMPLNVRPESLSNVE